MKKADTLDLSVVDDRVCVTIWSHDRLAWYCSMIKTLSCTVSKRVGFVRIYLVQVCNFLFNQLESKTFLLGKINYIYSHTFQLLYIIKSIFYKNILTKPSDPKNLKKLPHSLAAEQF